MKPFFEQPGVKLYHGDCRDVMQQLIESQQSRFDLVLADPPFNIGQHYVGHRDNMEARAYRKFTDEWFTLAWYAAKANGLVAVHCPDAVAQQMLRYDHPQLLHWINWHYRFGQAKRVDTARSCINCREHLLVFGLDDEETTFHPPLVRSDRAAKYNDERTQGTDTPGVRVAFNVWGLPEDGPHWGRVQGNNSERWNKQHGALVDHPNQLPEVYVERILRTFTDRSNRVLVPFAGSGTELVVAQSLGREVVGIEKSKLGCRSIARRLKKGSVRL